VKNKEGRSKNIFNLNIGTIIINKRNATKPITKKNPIKSLGEIKLQPTALELEAVKVIDDKPIFEFEADKMIYNSSDDIVAGK